MSTPEAPAIPPHSFRVPPDLDGARLDHALVALMPGLSRSRLQAWIARGGVKVDGAPVLRSGARLAVGARLDVEPREESRSREPRATPQRLCVLHADEHVVVIDKPASVLCHPTPRSIGPTIADLATAEFGPMPSPQGSGRPGIVHRLDGGTSGVMVLCRTDVAFAGLLAQFRSRSVEKVYLAIVHNEPRFDSDWIEAEIARNPRAPQQRIVVPDGTGRPSSTFYSVRERLRGFALLECRPKTGRTHQIRVHLTHIGLPIVGDRSYKHHGPLRVPLAKSAPAIARQALHAWKLSFDHPVDSKRMSFEAQLPEDMSTLWNWLRREQAPRA